MDHFNILAESLKENLNANGQRRCIEEGRPGEKASLVASVKPVTYRISLHKFKNIPQRYGKKKAKLVLYVMEPNRNTFSRNISWGDVWLRECSHAVVISKIVM